MHAKKTNNEINHTINQSHSRHFYSLKFMTITFSVIILTFTTTLNLTNKTIVDIRLRRRCAVPPPPIAADNRLIQRLQSGDSQGVRLVEHVFPKITPLGILPTIGNKHQKFGKDRTCGSRDILADIQTTHTFRRTHHNTSQPLPRAM